MEISKLFMKRKVIKRKNNYNCLFIKNIKILELLDKINN